MKHPTIDYRNFMHCLSMAKGIDKDSPEFRNIQIFNLDGDKRLYMALMNGHTALVYRLPTVLDEGEENVYLTFPYTEKLEFFCKQNKNKSITITKEGNLQFVDGTIMESVNVKDLNSRYGVGGIELHTWEGVFAQIKSVCNSDSLCYSKAMGHGITPNMYKFIFGGVEKGDTVAVYGDSTNINGPQVIRISGLKNFLGVVMPMSSEKMMDDDNKDFFKGFWNI